MKNEPTLVAAKEELQQIVSTIISDESTRNLISHAAVLLSDVIQNPDGGIMDYTLLPQFRRILVPILIESFREITIPPIKGVSEDKKLKYHIEGIVLSSIQLLPESIHNLYIREYWKLI